MTSSKSTPDFQQLLLSSTDKLLVTYNDEQYDLTEFIPLHPGGKEVFADFMHKENGPTVTDPKEFGKRFDDVGHSKKAMKTLSEYKVSTGEKKEKRFERQVTLDYVYKKLVTKEDPMFFHKFFGFLSICSYVYRYLYILPVTGNLGFNENNLFNYITLAVHMILSSSSLIFHVLDKRIVSKAIIIWKEYQLHAIMFTLKSVVTCIIGMNYNLILQFLGQLCGKSCNESCQEACGLAQAKLILPFIITSHLFVVDEITRLYGTPGVTTIRNESDKDTSHEKFVTVLGVKINPMTYIRYFFSFYQFCGAGSHLLVTSPNLADFGYNTLIAIQSSAFLMTLYRKSIIKWYHHIFWYGGCLLLSLYYLSFAATPWFFIHIFAVFLLRTQLNISKYHLWLMYAIIELQVIPYCRENGYMSGYF